jgi:PmbA protein
LDNGLAIMSNLDTEHLLSIAARLVERAQKSNVDLAEAQAGQGWNLSTRVRLGETELLQESGHHSVALRVMRDQKVAVTSTSDVSDNGLERCVRDALELLELTEPDVFAGPADPALLTKPPFLDLELFDPTVDSIDAAQAISWAREAERAALDHDPRLSLSEGASFSRNSGATALVLSSGFQGVQRGSYASLSVSPVALDKDDKRRRGYYWTARRHLSELESAQAVGAEAARRTLRQLGPSKVESCVAPVVFDQDTARAIIGHFASCIVGGALWRKSSYLLGRVDSAVGSPLLTLVDNPLLPRGPGSKTFDGEGLAARKNVIVEQGVLKTYLLDSYSGRKMGLASTGSASRSGGSVSASTSNLIMSPGSISPQELIAQTPKGLLVTELMGFGFNAVTGDFSRGASGFWIEDGQAKFPVSEVTISGNLNSMLQAIDSVADDLDCKTSIAAPTFRVASMTISGT